MRGGPHWNKYEKKNEGEKRAQFSKTKEHVKVTMLAYRETMEACSYSSITRRLPL